MPGYRRAGWRGLLVAGVCFITPAALIVLALAWLWWRAALPRGACVGVDRAGPLGLAGEGRRGRAQLLQ